MNLEPYQIVKAPVLTEESTLQSENRNQFTFRVDPRANKIQIRDAVEKLFNVKVLSVNTMNYAGKKRRRGRQEGRKASWKKAVVTLQQGDVIDLL
ncbi:MAG: 50S ribosomal protein L23 [bacterium]|nr:50S ribosomal protein L23 [bacterium]